MTLLSGVTLTFCCGLFVVQTQQLLFCVTGRFILSVQICQRVSIQLCAGRLHLFLNCQHLSRMNQHLIVWESVKLTIIFIIDYCELFFSSSIVQLEEQILLLEKLEMFCISPIILLLKLLINFLSSG